MKDREELMKISNEVIRMLVEKDLNFNEAMTVFGDMVVASTVKLMQLHPDAGLSDVAIKMLDSVKDTIMQYASEEGIGTAAKHTVGVMLDIPKGQPS